ncbi:hypothetical protein [Paramagnetospirillum caucaseum]|uniref:hypothetical protein n=1 Tax=Paramagnetospirillum caucaseum TaxID=1244869 RepID=UPI0012684165|nr:hypothetical protein [Paramagnetospirillum caucaseum]
MRLRDFEPADKIVYLISFTAAGRVRRTDGQNTPIRVVALGRTVADAVVTVTDGSMSKHSDRRYAAVVVSGTALQWGNAGICGQDSTIDQFLGSSIWLQSGQIDGVIMNPTIRVNRITQVDPRTGDVDFNDLGRNCMSDSRTKVGHSSSAG